MHPRNRHQDRYDLTALTKGSPELKKHIITTKYGSESIDFSNAESVKALNQAILRTSYGVKVWDIPKDYLCPPIPGRADYIHYAADLLKLKKDVHILDIGTGANCVYPLIGHHEYGWSFVGTEVDQGAFANAQKIVQENELESFIEIRKQSPPHIFKGILLPNERFDLTICNPPFHASAEEARAGTNRKLQNLKLPKGELNFGGQSQELWCPGGETAFITRMMEESVEFKHQCLWFSSLVSKDENLPKLKKTLNNLRPQDVQVIEMQQGQKRSRFIAWTWAEKFL